MIDTSHNQQKDLGIPVSVVIATHDRTDLLRRTLESLVEATQPVVVRYIVVENGSNCADAVVKEFYDRIPILFHRTAEPGKSRALNWAISQIESGLIVFLDDDLRIAPHTLRCYEEAVKRHGRGCVYGGPVRIDYAHTHPEEWLTPSLPRSVQGWEPTDENDPSILKLLFLGGNYGVLAEDIKALGGFRPDLGPGARKPGTDGNPTSQEYELQLRLVNAGNRLIYLKEAVVWHFVPPERCSPDWALHRHFRMAYAASLLSEENADANSVLRFRRGLQLWLKVMQTLHRFLYSYIVRNERKRFFFRKGTFQRWGRVRGFYAANTKSQK